MSTPSYPAHLISQWRAPDGTRVIVRPIRPEDASVEKDFVKMLSSEARYYRFMSTIRELTPQMVARFTCIDYERDMAFVAILGEPGRDEKEIGVARYVSHPDGKSCEFAIVIADKWQRSGLGRYMLDRLVDVAQSRGLVMMTGEILARNQGMLKLARQMGFKIGQSPADPSLRRAMLSLSRG